MTVIFLASPEQLAMDDFIQQDDPPKDPNTGEEVSLLTNFEWDWPAGKKPVKVGTMLAFPDMTLMINPDCAIWKESKALTDDKVAEEVLSHEQVHYDIARAIGRVVARKLEALRAKTVADLDNAADALLHYHFRRRGPLIHKTYDKETEHGKVKDNQAIWKQAIKTTLANKNALQIRGWWL